VCQKNLNVSLGSTPIPIILVVRYLGERDPMLAGYVVERAADGSLKVWEQPSYLFGAIFVLPGLAGVAFSVYRAIRIRNPGPLIGILFFCFFIFGGLRAMNTGSLTLDRSRNLASFHDPSWLWHDDFSVPLDRVHYADLRTGSHDSALIVILNNGDRLQLGDMDQATGKGRAAHAINEYIGYTDR